MVVHYAVAILLFVLTVLVVAAVAAVAAVAVAAVAVAGKASNFIVFCGTNSGHHYYRFCC